jgi:hypothetical protein
MTYLPPVAIIIPNYNMPEATDALGDYIQANIKYPHKLIVVDNGSDLAPVSKWTKLRLDENLQTTAGWLMGLHLADCIERKYGEEFFAYWFLITSTLFPDPSTNSPDLLAPMVRFLQEEPEAVGIHHALTYDSTTSWRHLIDRGTKNPRRTWMLDNISSVYRARWFNQIGRFDPDLSMGWGVDFETCYLARVSGRSLWVFDGLCVKKITDIGYTMGRMNMSSEQRQLLASRNMDLVLRRRYGPGWESIMRHASVDESWR